MSKILVVSLLILALALSATSGLAAEQTFRIGETVPFTITDSSLETLVLTLPRDNIFVNNTITPGIPNGYQVVINHNDHFVHIGGNAVVVDFEGDTATIKMQGNALRLSIGNKLFKGKELKVTAYFGNHTAVVRG